MKRNKRDMPQWFDTACAVWFRKNVTEQEFKNMVERVEGMQIEARANGIDPKDVSMYWYKSKSYSLMVKNQKQDLYKIFQDEVIPKIEEIAITYPPKQYPKIKKDGVCLVLNLTDIHIGKLAYNHTLSSIKEIFLSAAFSLLETAKKNYKIESIIIVGGHDILHTENGKSTTKGTPQDTDGLWHEHYNIALECNIRILEAFQDVAPIHYIHCMSNHDYFIGWTLSKSIEAYFSNCDNITFDTSTKHRKYAQYGSNLFGFSHGDKASNATLIDLMKYEAKDSWSNSLFGYWYLGHLHHLIQKVNNKQEEKEERDVLILKKYNQNIKNSILVHHCRSLSGSDTYHENMGYTGQVRALEAGIHHYKKGRIAVLTEVVGVEK
jgi:hypothetical protein